MRIDIDTSPPSDWDSYVVRHANASAYHRANAVEIGKKAFGLEATFLSCRDSQARLKGVLPLVEQSSMVFGRFLVSLPFVTYGGPLADDPETSLELAEGAAAFARDRGVDHLELRTVAPVLSERFARRTDKVSMILSLPESEKQLEKALGTKLRSQIRRAAQEEPEIYWGGPELLPEFYRLFALTMHRLGTPVYPISFFDVVCDALGDQASVLLVRARGVAAAGAVTVCHGDSIEVPWAAATDAAKRTAVNMRLYWEMLRMAIRRGARWFDFGRSSVDSGTYRFKAQWGAQPRQLHWCYWLPPGAAIPRLNHGNPKYAVAAAVWRRMPLWCANAIGPRIARHLP